MDDDEFIELTPIDDTFVESKSDTVKLHTALSKFECKTCGRSPAWMLDPDPDSIRYYTEDPCDCGYRFTIVPTHCFIRCAEADI